MLVNAFVDKSNIYGKACLSTHIRSKVFAMAIGNAKSPERRKGYTGKNISIFFKKVRERRLELGLKQSDVGKKMGVPQTRISELEGGSYPESPEKLIALARALNTTPDYLFGFREEP